MKFWQILGITLCMTAFPSFGATGEFVIYGVYRGLNFGNPGEMPEKDYYINMGSNQGVEEGSVIEVFRRTPTYDILNNQSFGDMTVKIGFAKVIHVEPKMAIVRLDHLLESAKRASTTPPGFMAGDYVRLPDSH